VTISRDHLGIPTIRTHASQAGSPAGTFFSRSIRLHAPGLGILSRGSRVSGGPLS
jgi:hypothetical protein